MSVFTRRGLRDSGVTDRQIAAAVSTGRLIRVRGGLFVDQQVDADVVAALRAGGRLACASELRRRGAWVLDDRLHVHCSQSVSPSHEVVRHWRRLAEPPGTASVSTLDALAQVLTCLDRRSALATTDSALHLGLVSRAQLQRLRLPARSHRIAALADGRAESGLESIARLIAHDLGLVARPQVVFRGIGRVDLLIEEVVVVEADGDAFHTDLAARRRDRRRDAQLAAIGHPVLRFGFDQLVGRPDEVARALVRVVAGHRSVKDSSRIAARALTRAQRRGWA